MQDAVKEDSREEIGKKKTSSRKDTSRRFNFRKTKVYSDRSMTGEFHLLEFEFEFHEFLTLFLNSHFKIVCV